jgi:SanA protein
MSNLRRWIKRLAITLVAILIITLLIDAWVTSSTRNQIYNNIAAIPHHKVGLLLGTSKFAAGHHINLFYKYRIDAAAALYHKGRIDYILVSGDNRRVDYNEPETMQADLIAAGVPLNHIVLDYAGFRTLDSIVRCRDVFGETEITIISQPFHNARALFIANHKGMKAIAFNARDVPGMSGSKVGLREKGARVKMLLDLMFGKAPHFYGPRITIG